MEVNLQELLVARNFSGAEKFCRLMIEGGNALPEIWFYFAIACQEQGKHDVALAAIENILETAAENQNVHSLHATILSSLKRFDEALNAAKRVIEITPDSSEPLKNAGAICELSKNYELAIDFYNNALALNPLDISTNISLASTLVLAGKHADAQAHCLQAVECFSECADLYNVLAESYIHTGDWDKALEACNTGLRLNNSFAFLYFRKGLLLSYLARFSEAQEALNKARELRQDIVEVYFSEAQTNKYDQKLLASGINSRLVFLELAHTKQLNCDWRMWGQYSQTLTDYISLASTKEISRSLAFRVFNRPVSSRLRLSLMRRISSSVKENTAAFKHPPYSNEIRIRPQLRIGYISADFYQHPTSILTRQLYRMHDRLKFKIYAYSIIAAKSEDIYQKEIALNCDVFRNVSGLTEIEISDIIHEDEIDILIDLGQYATADGRLEVLALRPAPIQINYLAFMETTGAEFIDYAIVDNFVCPDGQSEYWTESLIRLPSSLYIYDNSIPNLPTKLRRQDYGLPEAGVVYCCFNNDYKIEPEIFSIWMKILNAVPNSVLWLLGSTQTVQSALINEAAKLGIEPERLIFAGRASLEIHIQRYQLADIFLDTHWFNGHTTSLEALWQGLPVLTWCGEVTSSRVAASFLNVLNLPELIAHNRDEYEEKAIYYAINHQARVMLRDKLISNRSTSPLFNTVATVKHLELAYELIWSRYMNNLEPADLHVPSIPTLNW